MKSLWSGVACLVLWSSSCLLAADDPTRKVQDLELAGQNSERASAVAELQRSAPDAAETHWLAGEVKVDEEWVPYSKVADHGDRWSELYKYKEERAKRTDSAEDQLFLADGAKQHRLFDEERAHLHGVIAKNPMHAEARQRLGHVLLAGVWMTPNDFSRAAASSKETELAFSRWEKDIQEMKANLSNRSVKRRQTAVAYFEALKDPAAIPVMERAFALGTESDQIGYFTWVCRLNTWQASAAIARLAMASDSAVVRLQAVKELHHRRSEEYVPVLLSVMQAPIEVETELVQYGHWWLYSQRTTTETAKQSTVTQYNARFAPQSCIRHPFRPLLNSDDTLLNQPHTGERIMSNIARENQQAAGERNAQVSAWNDRASFILSESQGVSGIDTPQNWWVWWTHDQGYIEGEKEQVFAQYSEEWYISRRRGALRRESKHTAERLEGHASCFVAGTPVVTEYGSKPIESIQRGDRVLTQNPETGELTFKPVIRATRTSRALTRTVTIGDETLTCTTAHPFWVNGKGWRMARELEPGMRFHSLQSSVDVTATAEASSADVYNLEVADFNTYFVGKSQVLTHDVTIRQPTDMLLPGLVRAAVVP